MYPATANQWYYGEGKLIGTIDVLEGTKNRQSFETAAWFKDFVLDAGTYPVYRFERGDDVMFMATVPGTCTAAYLGTLWGGLAVGKDTSGPREVGTRDDRPLSVSFTYYEPNRDNMEVVAKYLGYQGAVNFKLL